MDAQVITSTATVVVSNVGQFFDGLNLVLNNVDRIISSPVLGHLVTWLVALFGGGSCFKWLKNRQVEKVAHLAFMAVEEAARRDTRENALDKAALFCKHFEAMMRRSGWWGVNPDDLKHAQAIADALNLAYENAKALAEKNGTAPAQPPKP